GAVSGRRWRRPERVCPPWCAGDHRCTARHGYPSGQHRSRMLAWRSWYGRLIATRVEASSGESQLEIRAVAKLDDDEQVAHEQAQLLAVRIDQVIRDVLGTPTTPDAAANRPAIAGDLIHPAPTRHGDWPRV